MGESGETILARKKWELYLKLWELNVKLDHGQTDKRI